MKIVNSRRINDKFASFFEIHSASTTVNTMLTHYISSTSVIPSDIESLRKEAESVKKSEKIPFSIERIMMLLILKDMVEQILAGYPDEIFAFFMDKLVEESKVFNLEEINQNSYIRDIDFRDKSLGDFELRYMSSMPFEFQLYDVPRRIDELFVRIPRICCFADKYEYPAIFQKSIKSTWMSVSPNEIYTVQEHIDMAKGKVLTLGCGMGYFAYMASLKDEVTSITIIEREESVIELFETAILPQFKTKDKIKVIKADAIDFMASLEDGEYDYCFADIWIGVNDMAPYFAIKEIGRKLKKTKISYWIEQAFAMVLEGYVYMEIMNAFLEANGKKSPESDYPFSEEEERGRNYIQRLLKNEVISKPEHIDYYMNPDNIIKLIEQTDIVF